LKLCELETKIIPIVPIVINSMRNNNVSQYSKSKNSVIFCLPQQAQKLNHKLSLRYPLQNLEVAHAVKCSKYASK